MLACVSPSMASFSMTESTIRFAQSVKKIRTKPRQNDDLDGTLVSNLRAEIEHLRQQLSRSRDSVGLALWVRKVCVFHDSCLV